jgi:hypothetical protein
MSMKIFGSISVFLTWVTGLHHEIRYPTLTWPQHWQLARTLSGLRWSNVRRGRVKLPTDTTGISVTCPIFHP